MVAIDAHHPKHARNDSSAGDGPQNKVEQRQRKLKVHHLVAEKALKGGPLRIAYEKSAKPQKKDEKKTSHRAGPRRPPQTQCRARRCREYPGTRASGARKEKDQKNDDGVQRTPIRIRLDSCTMTRRVQMHRNTPELTCTSASRFLSMLSK